MISGCFLALDSREGSVEFKVGGQALVGLGCHDVSYSHTSRKHCKSNIQHTRWAVMVEGLSGEEARGIVQKLGY